MTGGLSGIQSRAKAFARHCFPFIAFNLVSMILGIIHPLFFGDHGFFEQYISIIGASEDLKMKSTCHPLIQNNMVPLGVLSWKSSPILVTILINSLGSQQIQRWIWLRAMWDLLWTIRLDLLFYGCSQINKFLNFNTFFIVSFMVSSDKMLIKTRCSLLQSKPTYWNQNQTLRQFQSEGVLS